MNGIDLDTLRAGWSSHQQELDASLRLDAQTLRATLLQRTGAAFRRHRGWLLASLLGASVCFSALMAFIVTHADDSIYRLLATPLAMLALAELIVDWRQWRALSRLDLDAPLLRRSPDQSPPSATSRSPSSAPSWSRQAGWASTIHQE